MSLWDGYPVPSRVLGLVHTALLLQTETVGAAESGATESDDEDATGTEKLDAAGAARFSRDELQRFVAPEVLMRQTGGETEMFPMTFLECVRFGLFTAQGEEFAVDEGIRQAALQGGRQRAAVLAGIPALDALTDAVRFQILRRLADGVDTNFSRLLAWSLMQSGGDYPLDSDKAERLATEQDPARSAVGFNTVRYGSFLYWTRFLGFGFLHTLSGRDCLQPDPTAAFERQMPEWFESDDERALLPLSVFLARAEQSFPYIEEGKIARSVRQDLAEPPARPEKTLNDASALALTRLERKNVIRLLRPSDAAEVFTLAWGGQRRNVSHISLASKGGGK